MSSSEETNEHLAEDLFLTDDDALHLGVEARHQCCGIVK
jgi:hypothetical protein